MDVFNVSALRKPCTAMLFSIQVQCLWVIYNNQLSRQCIATRVTSSAGVQARLQRCSQVVRSAGIVLSSIFSFWPCPFTCHKRAMRIREWICHLQWKANRNFGEKFGRSSFLHGVIKWVEYSNGRLIDYLASFSQLFKLHRLTRISVPRFHLYYSLTLSVTKWRWRNADIEIAALWNEYFIP